MFQQINQLNQLFDKCKLVINWYMISDHFKVTFSKYGALTT